MIGEDKCFDQFSTRRSGLLLARLASSLGQRVLREDLCRFLWPDEDADLAKPLLRNEIARLRRALGGDPPFLLVTRTSVSLDPSQIASDIVVAQRILDSIDPHSPAALELSQKAISLVKNPILARESLEGWLAPSRERRRDVLRSELNTYATAACANNSSVRIRRDFDIPRFPSEARRVSMIQPASTAAHKGDVATVLTHWFSVRW